MGRTTEGELGSCSDERVMFSKSLIQFSVDSWGCVPSLLFTWSQTMVEVMKIMVTSFIRSHACTATPSAPSPAAGHCRPTPPPETLGHSWARLGQSLVGSLLLSPGSWCTQGSDCACQEFLSQSCASSGSSIVELMTTSSKRGYAIPTFTAARCGASAPWQSTADAYILRRHKHSSVSVLWDLWILVCAGLFEPSEWFWQVWGLILNVILPLLPSCSRGW